MISAASLTSSATSLFWLTVVILGFTAILAIVGIFTLRATAIHKRRLLITITSRSRLLSAPESMRDELQIKYNGNNITGDPYVAAIELSNLGKTHIGSDDFDGQRSLKFSLDTKIIKLLSTEHSPNSAPAPVIDADGTTLSLMPELITKGERIKVAVLTDGRPTEVRVDFKPFGDVAVDTGDREVLESKRTRTMQIIAIVAGGLTVALVAINILLGVNAVNQSNSSLNSQEKFDGCGQLIHDVINTVSTLAILHGQAVEIKKGLSVPLSQISSYAELDLQAQAELIFTASDYQDLVTYGFLAKTNTMTSLAQEADKDLKNDGTPKSRQDIKTIDDQLAPVVAAFNSASSFPSACGSM